jgi:hypothetical protein
VATNASPCVDGTEQLVSYGERLPGDYILAGSAWWVRCVQIGDPPAVPSTTSSTQWLAHPVRVQRRPQTVEGGVFWRFLRWRGMW